VNENNFLIKVKIKKTPLKGFGVYALQDIKKDDIIELSPVLPFSPDREFKEKDKSFIWNYEIDWDDSRDALGLGYLSLYNHSDDPNAKFIKNTKENYIAVISQKDIKKDDEILIKYHCPIDFKVY